MYLPTTIYIYIYIYIYVYIICYGIYNITASIMHCLQEVTVYLAMHVYIYIQVQVYRYENNAIHMIRVYSISLITAVLYNKYKYPKYTSHSRVYIYICMYVFRTQVHESCGMTKGIEN